MSDTPTKSAKTDYRGPPAATGSAKRRKGPRSKSGYCEALHYVNGSHWYCVLGRHAPGSPHRDARGREWEDRT